MEELDGLHLLINHPLVLIVIFAIDFFGLGLLTAGISADHESAIFSTKVSVNFDESSILKLA